ncbi:MAG: DNA-directed RNA polymerase subunit beta' [Patescibacteria group bacterium]|nr:DNA-directed RNA polymerase subunit beta' [Patescibacteria group bacterium]MDD4304653.1 DNA-directed RNA polymerase subunit beta' [Patescibacteria group bacterium]MDD4695706.1 DNA-directed RNA polymerase subunit beta' [Patescibacteria group bacterium]
MPTPSSTKTSFAFNEVVKTPHFDSIKLTLASPDRIHEWSHGEVLKPETINYRTQKPERDGLFCEKIFGPTKDWECYCGKYKRIRYKGIVCDKCGVEVTRKSVRRERFGHIDLATPISHIWFLRGVPSKVGIILDLSIQQLERVIYFANFIVTDVDEELKKDVLNQIKQELKQKIKAIDKKYDVIICDLDSKVEEALKGGDKKEIFKLEDEKNVAIDSKVKENEELNEAAEIAKKELKQLKPLRIISESKYKELSLKYGHIFSADIGAGAVRKLLEKINLQELLEDLNEKIKTSPGSKQKKFIRRIRLIQNFLKNDIRPEWMILTSIPVIPPDLRPMVQLDGGRFATSDLNDLYRRVINRNNRLKRLQDLNAPEVILRNEKRMLQEAVDALIDNNARHGKTVTASTGQKRMLKSLADMLKGKQGRFRRNLLGKRVDYSGRSVIVVGPHLKLDECGLPKTMALELFKPFVIAKLIERELVHNVRSAKRYIDGSSDDVWEILEEITNKSYVLLNRAPTLHRLGIQAFKPRLIEGKAIRLHPMVCSAFNADFDGDQMAVHVPLSKNAIAEARDIMLSTKNLLKPATGDPVVLPTQDMVWGANYLTCIPYEDIPEKDIKIFSDGSTALSAYDLDKIGLQELIKVRINGEILKTSIGRVILNKVLPEKLRFFNEELKAGGIKDMVAKILDLYGDEKTIEFLDRIKKLTLKFITKSGLSWSMSDLPVIKEKGKLIEDANKEVMNIHDLYNSGFLTNRERYVKVIETWTAVKNKITERSKDIFPKYNSIYSMINSGARGSWSQMVQIMGMKGLVISPSGEIIELPIKANFDEGLDVLEYFISTHGTRKGLSDTALRTASAGYLTRRLVDVGQDIMASEADCGDREGRVMNKKESMEMGKTLGSRIKGRFVAEDVKDPNTGELILKKDSLVDKDVANKIDELQIENIRIRSILTCKTLNGVCQKCYGTDLSHNKLVKFGTAVGIMAAQSIGEPGTQLTMRTFHTGGIAGGDITQGLPRVEEILEARNPKMQAVISEIAGKVKISDIEDDAKKKAKLIQIISEENVLESYDLSDGLEVLVKDKQEIKKKQELFRKGDSSVKSINSGVINISKKLLQVIATRPITADYIVSGDVSIWVKNGDMVGAGIQLTEGSINLKRLYKLRGEEEVQKYIIKEIQHIYSSQGQKLNDKHIELVCRQLFSRIYVDDSGDTDFVPGETITRAQFIKANELMKSQNKNEAKGTTLLLGMTKASLTTDSFLSAASFQETARVLINAAIKGQIDKLRGLKENVIIGRLVPAGTGFEERERLAKIEREALEK